MAILKDKLNALVEQSPAKQRARERRESAREAWRIRAAEDHLFARCIKKAKEVAAEGQRKVLISEGIVPEYTYRAREYGLLWDYRKLDYDALKRRLEKAGFKVKNCFFGEWTGSSLDLARIELSF